MSNNAGSVEAVLKKVRDHQEIVDVLHRFMAAQDSADWGALLETITPDARVESARFGEMRGADEVIAVCKRALSHYDGIIHVMNNVRIEQDGDKAKVHYYAISYHLRRGVEGGETLTNRGMNTVDVVRTEKGWKLDCYRSSKISWQEGNPKVRVNKADPATHGG